MQHNFIHSQPKEWRIILFNEYNAKKSSLIIESDFWADAEKLSPGGVYRTGILAAMFAIGEKINGGRVYGQWPGPAPRTILINSLPFVPNGNL